MIHEIDKIISGFRKAERDGMIEKRYKLFLESSGDVRCKVFNSYTDSIPLFSFKNGLKMKIEEDIKNLLLLKYYLETDKKLGEDDKMQLLYYILLFNCLDNKVKDVWFIEPLIKNTGQYNEISNKSDSHSRYVLKFFETFTSNNVFLFPMFSVSKCFETENNFIVRFGWSKE